MCIFHLVNCYQNRRVTDMTCTYYYYVPMCCTYLRIVLSHNDIIILACASDVEVSKNKREYVNTLMTVYILYLLLNFIVKVFEKFSNKNPTPIILCSNF